MKTLFKLLLFCLLALPLTVSAQNSFYVATTGSGTVCTLAAPCATISQGLATAHAGIGSSGAVVHIKSGNYVAPSDISSALGGTSSTSRMVLQCDGPSFGSAISNAFLAKGQCTISSSSGGNYGFIVDSGNFFDLVGFDIGNNNNMTVAVDISCPSSGGAGQACPSGVNSIHIIGNYIHDFGSLVNNTGTHAGCLDAGAINEASQSYKSADLQILRNVIANVGAPFPSPVGGNCTFGIDLVGNGDIVENNIILNLSTGGIGSHGSCNLVIANNVVIAANLGYVPNTQLASAVCGQEGGTAGHNTIINNYAASTFDAFFQSTGAIPDCTVAKPTLYSHNITDTGTSTAGSNVVTNPPNTSVDFGNGAGANSCDTITPSPLTHQAGTAFFVNYQTNGTGDYHLGTASAGINAGSSTCVSGGQTPCVPSTDFAGATFSPLSVGVYVSASGSVVVTTPTRFRSVKSLPATCQAGNGIVPTDVVALVGSTTTVYWCSQTNTWSPL